MSVLRTLLTATAAVVVAATAAFAAPAASLLKGLKLPVPAGLPSLFAANAVGQISLNGQLGGTPEGLLAKLRTSLTNQGYSERTINTVSGPWGLNLVFDPPAGTSVDGTPAGKTAVLVLQATALGPGKLNLNVRYEAL
ncbi:MULTISPECIES: hypothetical protein [unclassified Synechococcus]|uniref:hypothetical protein n=1 Tax=unclassified Synechococcus TaxID=2626047 RepID=UPI00006980DC|nr:MULTISPECIES: hypothetical protein [unclassified Synechococcus]EAQ73780.1 hypothetical protein WH5701_10604 [Synechococcus sp. WH 5701]WFN58071.1 hypothetical protein N4320_09525 [Synechococcus sp. CCFWC 502]